MGVGGYEHLVFRDCKYIMLSPKMAEEHLTRSIFFSEDEATDQATDPIENAQDNNKLPTNKGASIYYQPDQEDALQIQITPQPLPQKTSPKPTSPSPPPSSPATLSVNLIQQLLQMGGRRQLVYTPIPPPIQMLFTIRKEKGVGLQESSFDCWIKKGAKDQFIMSAVRKGRHYHMGLEDSTGTTYLGKIQQYDQYYQLQDDGQYKHNSNWKQPITRRMASIHLSLLNSHRSLTLLTPTTSNHKISLIESNQLSNLFLLKQLQPNYKCETYCQGEDVDMAQETLGWERSKSNLILKHNGVVKMMLGVMGKNQFTMVMLDGMSPYQGFAVAVVWLG